ncbi:MAG: preprotein translocase subunit SecG [Chloroflexi bacterium]|nr:preprotein translocase subunit SecG [Chloroflexota bacterium]
MEVYLNIVQIIISIALVAVILLQVRSGGLGGVFGGTESAVYKTRRGVERTLFNITVGLSVAFFAVTIINVIIAG